jgi:putative addiction module CopG family antidote
MAAEAFELTEHEREFIRVAVESGTYKNGSHVVNTALRLLEREEEARLFKVERLRKLAQEGFDQLDRGEGIVLDSEEAIDAFMADIERKFQTGKDA